MPLPPQLQACIRVAGCSFLSALQGSLLGPLQAQTYSPTKFWLPVHERLFPLWVWYWNMSPSPAGEPSFTHRAWPLPPPPQDNHIRIPQADLERGTHPVAGSCFIINGYYDNTSVKDTLREGPGFLGAGEQSAARMEGGRLGHGPSRATCQVHARGAKVL